MSRSVKLIVGLGNPGSQYQRTRHNVGADFVRALAQQQHATLQEESRFFAETTRLTLAGQNIRLMIPTTFMNLSGKAVAALANFYQIPVEQILVVHDELDLAPGIARFKQGGGHGGHNGLRDIIQAMANSRDFARLRIGIGHPGHASQVTAYVLHKASPDDQIRIGNSLDRAINELPNAIQGKWQQAMTALHSS